MADEIHSTGRGGAGNIGRDPTTYVDGEIVREGFAGESGRTNEADFSTGRGGAGNIQHSPRVKPSADRTDSSDIIPETALRAGEGHENFHTGRGGAGNEHVEKFGGHSKDPNRETLGDKVKHLFHKEGHHDEKKHEESPLHQETRAE
ncbi:hypothetical protein EV356DRAFT_501780 [Viridothelium virens]|uniref:Uncharacterized protein n=1 Tax=Viridothelium virens TaxID=1048519 RepID=A0A6A6H9N3_VIRVR|nr:hypothetical protein EV356DRAFT_501780 [Viridothelium virens]